MGKVLNEDCDRQDKRDPPAGKILIHMYSRPPAHCKQLAKATGEKIIGLTHD